MKNQLYLAQLESYFRHYLLKLKNTIRHTITHISFTGFCIAVASDFHSSIYIRDLSNTYV